jgi:ABC-type bacteriocin/lantibiotic exporter with double-glycine peptidase domain
MYMAATIAIDNGKQIWRSLSKKNDDAKKADKKLKIDSREDDNETESLGFQENQTVIKFMNLTKRFGSYSAVDNLCLNLPKDQIFCLLGHNGAGKTTALNMLIGHHKPSSGTILLENLDIRKDLDDIRL